MGEIIIARGENIHDFFFIPTIRYHHRDGIYQYLTIEWLKWYIGLKIEGREPK